MSQLAAHFIRLVVILFGYTVACFAASAFLNLVLLGPLDLALGESRWFAGPLVVTVPLVALIVSFFTFLPAIAAIIVAEMLRRRDWLTYAITGGAIGFAVALFWGPAGPDGPQEADVLGISIVAAAGIVAGIAYWMTAGRWAGWRDGRRATSPAP